MKYRASTASNKQFGVRGGVARRNLCATLQVLLPPLVHHSVSKIKCFQFGKGSGVCCTTHIFLRISQQNKFILIYPSFLESIDKIE